MKKYTHIALILTLLFAAACSDHSRLRQLVGTMDRSCPESLGQMGTLESIRYDARANSVTFTYILNEDCVDVASFSQATDEQKSFLATFLRANDAGNAFLDEMVHADASLRLVYRGAASSDSVVLILNDRELRKIADAELADDIDRRQLADIVAITNARCPQTIDRGLILEGTQLTDSFITFHYRYDTAEYQFHNLDPASLQHDCTEALRAELTDVAGQAQLKLMKTAHLGAQYVFRADSAETRIVTIPSADIAAF